MQIRILFFASYRELVGSGEFLLDVSEPATVQDLLPILRERGGAYARLPAGAVVAVNRQFVPGDTPLREGDEVALVPPVAGG